MFRSLSTLISLVSLCGCIAMQIDSVISDYDAVADQIELGESKDSVLAILEPIQAGLPPTIRKKTDKYVKEGVRVEIYYMRTARQPDGLTTDDEFVPYLFNDDVLVAIGWQVLGGPKSQGQATSDVYVSNQNTTIVH